MSNGSISSDNLSRSSSGSNISVQQHQSEVAGTTNEAPQEETGVQLTAAANQATATHPSQVNESSGVAGMRAQLSNLRMGANDREQRENQAEGVGRQQTRRPNQFNALLIGADSFGPIRDGGVLNATMRAVQQVLRELEENEDHDVLEQVGGNDSLQQTESEPMSASFMTEMLTDRIQALRTQLHQRINGFTNISESFRNQFQSAVDTEIDGVMNQIEQANATLGAMHLTAMQRILFEPQSFLLQSSDSEVDVIRRAVDVYVTAVPETDRAGVRAAFDNHLNQIQSINKEIGINEFL